MIKELTRGSKMKINTRNMGNHKIRSFLVDGGTLTAGEAALMKGGVKNTPVLNKSLNRSLFNNSTTLNRSVGNLNKNRQFSSSKEYSSYLNEKTQDTSIQGKTLKDLGTSHSKEYYGQKEMSRPMSIKILKTSNSTIALNKKNLNMSSNNLQDSKSFTENGILSVFLIISKSSRAADK